MRIAREIRMNGARKTTQLAYKRYAGERANEIKYSKDFQNACFGDLIMGDVDIDVYLGEDCSRRVQGEPGDLVVGLEVTEKIENPIEFYANTYIMKVALSPEAHAALLSAAAGGRAVTAKGPIFYSWGGTHHGYYVWSLKGEPHRLDEHTPLELLA